MSQNKFCSSCGSRLEAGDKFCPGCGGAVQGTEVHEKSEKPGIQSPKRSTFKPIYLLLIAALIMVPLAIYAATSTGLLSAKDTEQEEVPAFLYAYVPDADRFESLEINGKTFYKALNGGREIAYIMLDSRGPGYGGDVRVNVTADTEGNVIAVEVTGHTETPGLGDKIEEQSWLAQFIGKGINDPISIGTDIDNISGATVSCRAVAAAVRDALDEIGAVFLGITWPERNLNALADGIYIGTGTGYGGDIHVEVTIWECKIITIDILGHSETPVLSDPAFRVVPQAIINDQNYEVDAVSGATMSSNGIMEAVFNALAR
ncbi:FMN-binding protein [Candidatus Contubernalis alkaliaceticus]|uniref:FMN-binding protein n=1 Tax=Candidatus Contubernalis alkaliaceticus TaxID=338645 RepID=UPI001F4BD30C|nr:FMN-binding protein [Candidatus Contubernalis alkalaceticus]UNC91098.1 FMN-binding protein [Candidatus Contubernalis alkalaceticus]